MSHPLPSFSNGWLFVLLVVFTAPLAAQQLPFFAQYREYQTYLNPGSISSDFLRGEYNFSAGLSARRQWMKHPRSPFTQFARVEYITDRRLVLGGHFINDQTGPTGFTGGYVRIAGIITDDEFRRGFMIGLSGGLVQYRLDGSELEFVQGNDPVDRSQFTRMLPDVGFGVFGYTSFGGYSNPDKLYGGVSVPQVFGRDLTLTAGDAELPYGRVNHFYGTLGYYKFLNDDSYIEPSLWFRYLPNAPVSANFNVRYAPMSTFYLGVGGGLRGQYQFEAGLVLGGYSDQSFRIGYAVGGSLRQYGGDLGMSHELNLSYSLYSG